MMQKRGLSHIEFVLSFVIFIGFILFAFAFFNPLQSQRTLKSSMDYAWIEVSQETKEKIETYSVAINSTVLEPIVGLNINGVPLRYNASVEDIDGKIISSYKDNGLVHFNREGKNFFRIKYSPAFSNGGVINGQSLQNNQYYISSSTAEEIYFERLLLELNSTYYSDYNGLKTSLNLPNRVDFGFVATLNGTEITALNAIPEGLEVLSRSDRIEVIRISGKREYGNLRVLVW